MSAFYTSAKTNWRDRPIARYRTTWKVWPFVVEAL